MGTTNKITDLLNRQPLTIPELAAELGISRNSAHLQVRKLEAAGVVEKLELQMTNSVGKPAYQYRTAAGGEDVHSSAYKPVLDSLVKTIHASFPQDERLSLFEKAGRALAKQSNLHPGDDVEEAIQKSVDVVNELGAMAEMTTIGTNIFVRCHSCPVATMVHHEPITCQMVAAFFSEASGTTVSVECKRNATVVCGFKFSALSKIE